MESGVSKYNRRRGKLVKRFNDHIIYFIKNPIIISKKSTRKQLKCAMITLSSFPDNDAVLLEPNMQHSFLSRFSLIRNLLAMNPTNCEQRDEWGFRSSLQMQQATAAVE